MRYFAIIAILLLGVAGFAQDKSATVKTGQTYLNLGFSAADTINESETYYVEVDNFQHFPQMVDVYVDIDTVTSGGSMQIVLQAKKFEGSSYASISDTVTWAQTADTTFTISTTTAARYRYYKLLFTADATEQQSIMDDVQFKFWDTGGDLSTASLSLTSNLTVTGTSTFTGAVTANDGVAVTDSIYIDGIKLIVRLDTLCAVSGTDTLRIFPAR
jgi:hypothetical protein